MPTVLICEKEFLESLNGLRSSKKMFHCLLWPMLIGYAAGMAVGICLLFRPYSQTGNILAMTGGTLLTAFLAILLIRQIRTFGGFERAAKAELAASSQDRRRFDVLIYSDGFLVRPTDGAPERFFPYQEVLHLDFGPENFCLRLQNELLRLRIRQFEAGNFAGVQGYLRAVLGNKIAV